MSELKNKYCVFRILALALLLLFHGTCLFAAASNATSGAAFLEMGVGSRPLGMGEAFTAAVDDINAAYYNPAGIATLRYPMLQMMHQELILDSRLENIAAAVPLFLGFASLTGTIFWVPSFDKIDILGNTTGEVQFYNASFVGTYAQSVGFMEVGGSLKYIYQKIDTLSLHSVAIDLGVLKRMYMYSPFDAPIRNFMLGLSLQNFGTSAHGTFDEKKDYPLPRLLRLGASYYPTKWLCFNVDMTQSCIDGTDLYDFTYGFDESFRINTGIELNYNNIVFLRGGYKFGEEEGKYSVGLGFNYAIRNLGFTIDASYNDAGIFGPVYSFTLTFKLIPKVITFDDQMKAEIHYQRGIKYYIANELDLAIEEFKTSRDYNPYHKNVKQKIKDLEFLRELKMKNEELEKLEPRL